VILAAVVLAAGSARRFGSDKLSATFDGKPLISHAIRAAQAAPVDRVVVVAHPALDLGASTELALVRLASGALSDSLRAGLAAAGDVDGLFVFLGDMPLVPHGAASRDIRSCFPGAHLATSCCSKAMLARASFCVRDPM
jgi:molybdenum cofactor cytidylyltransferase